MAAVTQAATALGLNGCGGLEVVRVGTSVLVASPDAQVMFRVDDQVPGARVERQVLVARLLQRYDVPAVQLAGGRRQPVQVGDPAVTVSAWQLEELTDQPVAPAEIGGLARRLHDIPAADAEQFGVQPFEPLIAITEQLAIAARRGMTRPSDLNLLAAINGRLAAAWSKAASSAEFGARTAPEPGSVRSSQAGEGLVHGDLHAGNVLATTRGPVVADLELAGVGPVAYDLVAVVVAVERYGAAASTIGDFASGYGRSIPEVDSHGVLRDTYELWLTAWAMANRHIDDDHDREASVRVARWLNRADATEPWSLL
jgi:hypothetical protein